MNRRGLPRQPEFITRHALTARVLGRKTLREGVLVSAIFFLAGVLTLAAQYIVPAALHMSLVVLLFGFIPLLLAPIISISTSLLSVLPRTKDRVDQCDH